MNDRDKIIDKIKKCLALSASSNEHEAAAALRQARKLMEAHSVSDAEMLAAGATEHRQRAGAQLTPSLWEMKLATCVGDAFGCRTIFGSGGRYGRASSKWIFIGCAPAPEIAGYAFEVLYRQCKRARETYIKTSLKRCKTTTKTRRADLFCEGWVVTVVGKIKAFAGTEKQDEAIDAYVASKFPALSGLNARNRNDGRSLRDNEVGDLIAGRLKGRDAELNRGVGGEQQRQIGG